MRYESKEALLSAIRDEHRALCARLDAIPKSRYREPGVWGDGWTVMDLVAHLAEWQRMFLGWYKDSLNGATPALPAPGYKWNETPRLNRAIWKKHRRRSFAAVRAEFDAGHRRMLELAEQLPSAQLLERGQFAWTGTSTLATYLGGNSASHYRFASKVLTRWLSGVVREEGQSTRQRAPRSRA